MLSKKNQERLWVVYFALLFFWSINAYIYIGKLFQSNELFALKIDGKPYISDFVNAYGAGILAKKNLTQPTPIYDRATQYKVQCQIIAPIKAEQPFYNQYPPYMFLLYLPLAWVSLQKAWLIWTTFSLFFIATASGFALKPWYKEKFAPLIAATARLSNYPVWLSFRLGQTSLFITPVVTLFYHALAGKRFIWTGLFASLALLKLQYVPVLAAVGIAIGGLHFLAGLAIGTIILTALAYRVLGKDNLLAFPQAILGGETGTAVSGVAAEMMQNVRGILVLLSGGDGQLVHIAAAICCVLAGLALFALWWKERKTIMDKRERFDLLFALTLFTMLFTSVHTHIQDYMLAFLGCEIIWLSISSGSRKSNRYSKLDIWLKAAVLAFPLLSWPFFMLLPFLQLVKIQPFALWALAMIVLTALKLKETDTSPDA